jgi:hypothetical protein
MNQRTKQIINYIQNEAFKKHGSNLVNNQLAGVETGALDIEDIEVPNFELGEKIEKFVEQKIKVFLNNQILEKDESIRRIPSY